MKIKDLPVIVVESSSTGLQALKLTEEPFAGIIYTYGKVRFDEDEANDKLFIKFEYEILDEAGKGLSDKAPFEKYIGDILTELVHRGVAEHSLIYTGGIDENRAENSNKSNS